MCLILLALEHHPDYPLVLLANRDEYYARPTAPMAWWPDRDVLAGQDLQAGGTWLGLSRDGRFAALTNVREGGRPRTGTRSRGRLVLDVLGHGDPAAAAAGMAGDDYDGYNLLAGRLGPQPLLHWASNRAARGRALEPGVHGLSNAGLNTPWPKVREGCAELAGLLAGGEPDPEALFALLAERRMAADGELPATGVPLDFEKALSARFIETATYGTRSSTVLLLRRDGWLMSEERSFTPGRPDPIHGVRQRWRLER